MIFEDIIELQRRQAELSLPFAITRRRAIRNYYSVNDFVAIPVENCASFYNRTVDLPIKKANGTEIGYLFFTKGEAVPNIFALSEPKFVCFLKDISGLNVIEDAMIHTFQVDYLIIYREYLIEYIDTFMKAAPIWGFFNHGYPTLIINPPTTRVLTEIYVELLPKFSKEYYFEASVRGIKHSLAFERYLKYYHLLELNFDFDVIERIKRLDVVADSKSISMLLNEYKKEDIERLKYLFHTYCIDVNPIIERMLAITSFLPIAREIFYDFGKDSNPLKEVAKFNNVVGRGGGFTMVNCRAVGIQQASSVDEHRKFIGTLCAYWIYRIRNSIAHNKVGEYIMSHRDEPFVVQFGEPLLRECLRQLFS